MKPEDISKLTDEEIRELLNHPMSKEDAGRYRQMDEDSKWLLVLNLREMECDEQEDGDFNG